MEDMESRIELLNLEEATNNSKGWQSRDSHPRLHMITCRKIDRGHARKRIRRKISEKVYQVKGFCTLDRIQLLKKIRTVHGTWKRNNKETMKSVGSKEDKFRNQDTYYC